MTFFAGIDGGQTSTIAVIGDESGRILGRGRSGPADEIGISPDSSRLADALRDALADAQASARLAGDAEFAVIVAGVSGYEGRVYGRPPQLPAQRLVLMHDAAIAHAGALEGKPGIVAIAGTGSVVYWNDGKRGHMLGGWGYLFGDEGSAFWLAREALALMMRAQDGRSAEVSAPARAACEFFGKSSLREIARAFYAGEISRHRLASFSVEAAHFTAFREIVDRGMEHLAALVRSAIASGAPPTVARSGGVFANEAIREHFDSCVRAAGVRIVEPAHDPAAGALLLAYREAGMRIPALSA